jgi:hypothetical protein
MSNYYFHGIFEEFNKPVNKLKMTNHHGIKAWGQTLQHLANYDDGELSSLKPPNK